MLKKIYCIKDELAEIWSAPFCLNPKTANRTFAFMAKERNEVDCKDQMIYFMGWFDDETGKFELNNRPEEAYDLETGYKNEHKDD